MKNKNYLMTFWVIVFIAMIFTRLPMFYKYNYNLSFLPMIALSLLQYFIILANIGKFKIRYVIKNSPWIILSIVALVFFLAIGYGNKGGIETQNMVLLSILPAYFLGFYLGIHRNLKYLKILFAALYLVVTFYSLEVILLQSSLGNIYTQDSFFLSKQSTILYWPFVFYISNISLILLLSHFKKLIFRVMLIVSNVVVFLAVLYSDFLATKILYVIFLGIILTIATYRYSVKRIILFGALSLVAIIFISFEYISTLAGYMEDVYQSFVVISSFDTSKFDLITSGRYHVLNYSIDSFLDSPLWGKGGYWNYGNSSNVVASQHSSILDFFAFYGLFAIPILMMYVSFLRRAFSNKSKLNTLFSEDLSLFFKVVFGSQLAIFMVSLLNPYLLTYPPLDAITFLLGGWVLGLKYAHSKRKSLMLSKPLK